MDVSRTIIETDGTTIELSSNELRIAASAAGSGLTGGGGSALAVNPDNSTVEISSDQVRVKAGGLNNTHLNAAAGILRTQLGDGFTVASASSLTTSTTSTTYVTLATATATVGCSNTNAAWAGLEPSTLSTESYLYLTNSGGGYGYATFRFKKAGTVFLETRLGAYFGSAGTIYFPISSIRGLVSGTAIAISDSITCEWKVDSGVITVGIQAGAFRVRAV